MSIIISLAGLLPLVSTTVNAASYNIPYILCVDDEVYVSDDIIVLIAEDSKYTGTSARCWALGSYCVKIGYNDSLGQWVTEYILDTLSSSDIMYRYGASTKYPKLTAYSLVFTSPSREPAAFWAAKNIITNVDWNSNEQALVGSYSNDLTLLPHGLTQDAIEEIINAQLNTSTSVGATAQTIINNTTVYYNSYQAGDITSAEMQSYVTSNIDTLSDLEPSTLLDAMEINNGLMYNQAIQDQLLNTASSNVTTMINGYSNTISSAVANYQSGAVSQQEAVTIINNAINNLNAMITDGTASTTADISAVNAAINAAQSNLDSVIGYKDIDTVVSDKSQSSDQAELDYLDDMVAETTQSIDELAPSQYFDATQIAETQDVLSLVWDNDFVRKLLPVCAGFIVVCVILGIKYKV